MNKPLSLAARLHAYLRLMRLDRPIGTFLLLWPVLWSLWVAGSGQPDATLVLLFLLGTLLTRSAGCVINDYADRDFDGGVARTKDRPLATGAVSAKEALVLCVVLLLLAALILPLLNTATRWFALAAVPILVAYPFCKRVTNLPQLVLGIAFSWGIPMAFTAHDTALWPNAWIIFLANFCWIVAYDTAYAMADRDDDLKLGIKSTAILFAQYDRMIIFMLQFICLALLALLAARLTLTWHFYFGLVAALANALWQQWLMRMREPSQCFRAFLTNSWFGGFIFLGFLLTL